MICDGKTDNLICDSKDRVTKMELPRVQAKKKKHPLLSYICVWAFVNLTVRRHHQTPRLFFCSKPLPKSAKPTKPTPANTVPGDRFLLLPL